MRLNDFPCFVANHSKVSFCSISYGLRNIALHFLPGSGICGPNPWLFNVISI